jgi:5-methylcytosine-specific restriction protein A
MRNPRWTRDELILALDLYCILNRQYIDSRNPRIVELSNILNKLQVHRRESRQQNFRNPSGVSMKLSNFLSLDPAYGGKGLSAGSKLDEEVWNEFFIDASPGALPEQVARLHSLADLIREHIGDTKISSWFDEKEPDISFPEGIIVERIHKSRERNRSLVTRKKRSVLSNKGKLECEICGFDFSKFYGAIGEGFIECHHNVPLAELTASHKTKMKDLSLVCSNCHRMLHRARPWLRVEELQKSLGNDAGG